MDEISASHTAENALRTLPSVDALLRQPMIAPLLDEYPRNEVLKALRGALGTRRDALRAGGETPVDLPSIALDVRDRLFARSRPSLRRVINATGIVLHTGLGRAPLADEAVEAIAECAASYCNLEFDLANGQRGDRHAHVRELLRELTGAEDALVVNNNAAATWLTLHTLARSRSAIVSRGELVEIGGSYRLPDIMSAAGCRLVEVGTTNRTRIGDYERAIDPETAVLLRVHTSNYRIQGFTESATLAELVALARRDAQFHVVDDLGSGLLDATFAQPGWDEPSVRDSVAAGADLTLFSGDKLLGGPQSGIVVGRAELVRRLHQNSLARALRPDKLTIAGLEATLRLYRDPEALRRRLPVQRMLGKAGDALRELAESLQQQIAEAVPDAEATCLAGESFAGGGSLPALALPTWVVRVRPASASVEQLAAALRQRELPIVCRVHEGALVFDCRTLTTDDAEQIAAALCNPEG